VPFSFAFARLNALHAAVRHSNTPDEERTTSPRKVQGRREGVGGAIEEGVVDDTTERQSEVARVNVVEAGV